MGWCKPGQPRVTFAGSGNAAVVTVRLDPYSSAAAAATSAGASSGVTSASYVGVTAAVGLSSVQPCSLSCPKKKKNMFIVMPQKKKKLQWRIQKPALICIK